MTTTTTMMMMMMTMMTMMMMVMMMMMMMMLKKKRKKEDEAEDKHEQHQPELCSSLFPSFCRVELDRLQKGQGAGIEPNDLPKQDIEMPGTPNGESSGSCGKLMLAGEVMRDAPYESLWYTLRLFLR